MGMTPPIELPIWDVDSLILMVMALVVFGPRRLPEIGRQIGKLMYEFARLQRLQVPDGRGVAELRGCRTAEEDEERQRALAAPAQTAGTIEAVSQFRKRDWDARDD